MAFTIEHLYKAREFVDLKNIAGNHLELSFKNPILAMLAKGKIAEIAKECGPDKPFTSCKLEGNDVHMTYNPELISERLLGEVFTGDNEKAKQAVLAIADKVKDVMQA